ncbi:hypothetical protein TVAG_159880 [Trichomonas vaginalis G3]|uniref:Uncharacterized protein n=1 Tax=Trichomonas vaginalis (strain ATCC PRA-98 / G3) TaxID=412133 RepID=A2DUT0_TRIV3|nr:armadillo (ARM) repeat-containing protein family [Trichomonas vaginalis G3]EAY15815.1 hypothetical protein TVAG_159880 [Trichomonas vaginalis G3]KAI5525014.1 armadillo (ARM) repeat-containing protein family [Trichomonas vaginalis G3]|eukprot:XP_001328038.1 hypothetical protein [Trichomonas vaginalis G3]
MNTDEIFNAIIESTKGDQAALDFLNGILMDPTSKIQLYNVGFQIISQTEDFSIINNVLTYTAHIITPNISNPLEYLSEIFNSMDDKFQKIDLLISCFNFKNTELSNIVSKHLLNIFYLLNQNDRNDLYEKLQTVFRSTQEYEIKSSILKVFLEIFSIKNTKILESFIIRMREVASEAKEFISGDFPEEFKISGLEFLTIASKNQRRSDSDKILEIMLQLFSNCNNPAVYSALVKLLIQFCKNSKNSLSSDYTYLIKMYEVMKDKFEIEEYQKPFLHAWKKIFEIFINVNTVIENEFTRIAELVYPTMFNVMDMASEIDLEDEKNSLQFYCQSFLIILAEMIQEPFFEKLDEYISSKFAAISDEDAAEKIISGLYTFPAMAAVNIDESREYINNYLETILQLTVQENDLVRVLAVKNIKKFIKRNVILEENITDVLAFSLEQLSTSNPEILKGQLAICRSIFKQCTEFQTENLVGNNIEAIFGALVGTIKNPAFTNELMLTEIFGTLALVIKSLPITITPDSLSQLFNEIVDSFNNGDSAAKNIIVMVIKEFIPKSFMINGFGDALAQLLLQNMTQDASECDNIIGCLDYLFMNMTHDTLNYFEASYQILIPYITEQSNIRAILCLGSLFRFSGRTDERISDQTLIECVEIIISKLRIYQNEDETVALFSTLSDVLKRYPQMNENDEHLANIKEVINNYIQTIPLMINENKQQFIVELFLSLMQVLREMIEILNQNQEEVEYYVEMIKQTLVELNLLDIHSTKKTKYEDVMKTILFAIEIMIKAGEVSPTAKKAATFHVVGNYLRIAIYSNNLSYDVAQRARSLRALRDNL